MGDSRSSRALNRILDCEKGPDQKLGDKLRALVAKGAVHRATLWRLRNGKGKPDALTMQLLHEATDGRVAFDGWGRAKRRSKKAGGEEQAGA